MTRRNHVCRAHDRRSVCIHCSGHPIFPTRLVECRDVRYCWWLRRELYAVAVGFMTMLRQLVWSEWSWSTS